MIVAATFGPRASDEIGGVGGGDMLEAPIFRPGKSRDQRREHAVDEHRLAVEDVDLGIGHLAVDEQRHADPLHRLERGTDAARCR